MSMLTRREHDLTSWFNRMDRVFDEWLRTLPVHRPAGTSWEWPGHDLIEVDEYRENGTEVIRADIAGIDPERDVEITVVDGLLRIRAERRVEEKSEDRGYTRHELRYGSFTRTLPLPDGAAESDITATYKDGILEIRVPIAERPAPPAPTKIAVMKG